MTPPVAKTNCSLNFNHISIFVNDTGNFTVACETLEPIKKIIKAGNKLKHKKPPKTIPETDSVESSKSIPRSEDKKKPALKENTENKTMEQVIKFKSSITVLPSVVTDTSSFSKSSAEHLSEVSDSSVVTSKKTADDVFVARNSKDTAVTRVEIVKDTSQDSGDQKRRCQPECACTRCSSSGPCCGDPGSSMDQCKEKPKKHVRLKDFNDLKPRRPKCLSNWKLYLVLVIGILLSILLLFTIYLMPPKKTEKMIKRKRSDETGVFYPEWGWQCYNNLCQKVFRPGSNVSIHSSLSRCTLLCMGPQLWPYPIGYTHFSKTLVALATKKLQYKFQAIPSDSVHQYLAEAFNLFLRDLVTLEKINSKCENNTDLVIKKMYIQMEVDTDADPRMRTNTDESYTLSIESKAHQLTIKISSPSFCGLRHGLETLSQLIVLDQSSGYLITLSSAIIKDGPSYKYRGLMIDTGRNFIPIPDLMRTIDGMAACKLNTLHWRISDVTSFPLQVPDLPKLSEYGPYDRSMVYSKEDVRALVDRARVRGIRVLIEVALPGPVGRPWSWFPAASCPRKSDNYTCDNVVCLRLKMQDAMFDTLQIIYSEILDLTNVDDIFHFSDGVFSLSNCYSLMEDREGFLDKALERLKLANGGFLPKLPIIWYTAHLTRDLEARTWDRYGVQLNEWNPNLSYPFLYKFRVIHSFKWDLSCEMKKQRCTKYRSWQEMYSWRTWRNLEVFTTEGGEAVLWTDLVDSGNLDDHLWPRTAAVAERLWSDLVVNSSVNRFVYTRLDAQRWRMLLRGVQVQPIWPAWCSFNPGTCLDEVF